MNGIGQDGSLDADELLHLALKAIEADRNDEALVFLKRALLLEPDNGRLHYLLGAVHAEIGMIDRAIAEIARATELDLDVGIANFQLGLLHLTRGDFEAAQQAWLALDQLDEDDPLRVFKTGFVHLGNDDYEACIAEMKRGLSLSGHESLNEDMRRVLAEAEAALEAERVAGGAEGKAGSVAQGPGVEQASRHVLLAGYGDS